MEMGNGQAWRCAVLKRREEQIAVCDGRVEAAGGRSQGGRRTGSKRCAGGQGRWTGPVVGAPGVGWMDGG